MAVDIEKSIAYMYSLKKKGIYYSMSGSRTGKDGSGDCSGTLYQGLRNAGMPNAGWVLNTDSMHDWLTKNGWKLLAHNKNWTAKRGDIVIFGKKGASGGAAGHVVQFISNTQIIHCTYKSASANGVYVDNEATTCPYSMGWYAYRYAGKKPAKTTKPSSSNKNTSSKNPAGFHKEVAIFVNGDTAIQQRKNKAGLSATKAGKLKAKASIQYDGYVVKDGYTWVRSGSTWTPVRQGTKAWGKFKEVPSTKSKKKDWSKQYYTSNPKKVKLLKNDGLYGKNDVKFSGKKVGGNYKKGTVFVIKGIKKRSDGLPRLVTQSGFLLTANRKYVKKV